MAAEPRILPTTPGSGGRVWGATGPSRLFISYTVADRAWAEWIAWYLEEARYTTVLQAWTFAWRNFVVRMRDAMQTAARTLAVSVWEIVPPVGSNAFTG
jgi:TIR domain